MKPHRKPGEAFAPFGTLVEGRGRDAPVPAAPGRHERPEESGPAGRFFFACT